MVEFQNPYSMMRAAFEPTHFYGRRREVGSIVLGINADPPSSVLIMGFKLIGKTTLWRYLAHEEGARKEFPSLWVRYEPEGPNKVVFVYVDFYRFTGNFFPLIYDKVVEDETIKLVGGISSRMEQAESMESAVEGLKELFKRLQEENITPVICLDHFDEVVRGMDQEAESSLVKLKKLAPFIIILENSPAELNPRIQAIEKSPLFADMNTYTLGLLTQDEARQLILEPLKEVEGTEVVFTDAEIDFLLEKVGRHPYLLILACEWLFELYRSYPDVRVGKDEKLDQRIAEDLFWEESIKVVFTTFWKRLSDSEQVALHKVANADFEGLEKMQETLASLKHKGLIERNLMEGTYKVFSELFREFVKRVYERPMIVDIHQFRDKLAPLDRKLFDYLYSHAGQVCELEELYREAWTGSAKKGALAASISRIRAKLRDTFGPEWGYIRTVRGKGYQLVLSYKR